MRNPERIGRILKKLGRIWKENPDLRLGQLVEVLAARVAPEQSVFVVEDKLVEKALDEWIG